MSCWRKGQTSSKFNYTFRATFKREGYAAEEFLFDHGSLTIYMGENRTHHRIRGSSRLGTSINYVCLKLELKLSEDFIKN